jgi:hypothetical protein
VDKAIEAKDNVGTSQSLAAIMTDQLLKEKIGKPRKDDYPARWISGSYFYSA